jgi:hypothetical protein
MCGKTRSVVISRVDELRGGAGGGREKGLAWFGQLISLATELSRQDIIWFSASPWTQIAIK